MKEKKIKTNEPPQSENLEDIEVAGANSSDDASDDDNLDDTTVGVFKERNFDDERTDDNADEQLSEAHKSWPADCYSFIALNDPLGDPIIFLFGFMVWSFQIAFLILLVLRVISKKMNTNEDIDNPDSTFLASFIPSNVDNLSKATQYMTLLAYCLFADESVKDTVTAVEMWPTIKKSKKEDKIHMIMLSCVMRFSQGTLASIVVLLLVITTSDVIDLILNFTAVNFISGFDDVAFELAHWGKYGPKMEAEAKRIEDLTVPLCLHRKYHHVRYRYTIIPIALILVGMLTTITYNQASTKVWLTQRLRVQFEDDTIHEEYSGCYIINDSSTENRAKNKRVVYDSYEKNGVVAKFGYCEKQKKWILYDGDSLDPCNVKENVALSDRTSSFDIGTSFEGTWASASGTPLELYFFQDEEDLDDEQCGSFLGDGICNHNFNVEGYSYDSGDCCAATCKETNCGVGGLKKIFGTDIEFGHGFPECRDPDMVPITIYLNNVYIIKEFDAKKGRKPYDDKPPIEPLLTLDCDGKSLLVASINSTMMGKSQTVKVADGASCSMMVKNVTSPIFDIWFVDYTIYHGNQSSIGTDPIVIATGDSAENEMIKFQRIHNCFLTKLGDYINKTTIYTGTDPSNQAIDWLMQDTLGHGNCRHKHFIERYALATINFAAPVLVTTIEGADNNNSINNEVLWIREDRQCAWRNVACYDGWVSSLELGLKSNIVISGTMATEIGLLKRLKRIDMSHNDLRGTIPPNIGQWTKLRSIHIDYNMFTGTIPKEIAQLTDLHALFIGSNDFTGTIPTTLAKVSSLQMLTMHSNGFNGTLPDEIGSMSNLEKANFSSNLLIGTIPSTYGDLQEVRELDLSYNSIIGKIPTELGRLQQVKTIYLEYNKLTGSVPQELLDGSIEDIYVYGNQLSGLIPVEGDAICSSEGGEHYCNCGNDCLGDQNYCKCEEGQSCCASFLDQLTECIICEDSELQNPDFYVKERGATCSDAANSTRESKQFGTDEECKKVKRALKNFGCSCLGDDPNAKTFDIPSPPAGEGPNADTIVV